MLIVLIICCSIFQSGMLLHCAVGTSNEMLGLLRLSGLENGADRSIRDASGVTLIKRAERIRKNQLVIGLLRGVIGPATETRSAYYYGPSQL